MEAWAITTGLIVMIVMGSLASVGWDLFEMRNRENWWWTCILFIEAAVMPNPYLGAVLAMFTIGLFQIGRSWFILRGIVIPVAGLAGAYLVILPHLTVSSVRPILWAIVAVGIGLGLWGLLGVWKAERPWTVAVPKTWFGMWGMYEHSTEAMRHICGQGNTLHLVSVASVTVTAAIGLILMGSWGAWLALPVCVTPIALTWWNQVRYDAARGHNVPGRGQFGQPAFVALVLMGGIALVEWPTVTVWIVLALIGVACLVIGLAKPWEQRHLWHDSGRLAYWKDALLLVWWPAGWKVRLIGFGTSTWFVSTVRMAEQRQHINVYTTAHNEYVQCLVEHGVIGVTVLVAYLGDGLWRAFHAGPEGQAVFLLGLMVCAIATISFPWTFFHEYHPRTTQEESWYGSPTMNILSFVLAILIDLF